ncbi:NAD(P)H-dependent oxidoreductase [uncultured Citricoccus sp.]|uniref:NAD(P)H-dependent oxidoreductase n=1 Tax=uncultured Citricoccus sp. TaxID=614031 RepID=UPI002624694B|nr:NAD(P)H-dependent oxidoreductase [uncultured Citricoccus sp.]
MTALNLVSLSASPHEPSKTTALLDAIVQELAIHLEFSERRVLMSEIGAELGCALSRKGVGENAARALEAVENADLIVVSTPTYRAAYPGLFKHFFDFVPQDALTGTPVFLSAIGGNISHSLTIDHQLRPLFSFFQAIALPTGVFAENADFDGYTAREGLLSTISHAVGQSLHIINATTEKAIP